MHNLNDLKKKLNERAQGPCVLMRWNYGNNVVADHFVPVSDVRLTCVRVDKSSRMSLSVSAPYMKKALGQSKLYMADKSIVMVTDGPRKGINSRMSDLRPDEQATELNGIARCLNEEELTARQRDRIHSMVTSDALVPSDDVVFPKFYVLTRKVKSLTMNWTRSLFELLNIDPFEDDSRVRRDKLLENVDKIGIRTGDGYVIDPKYVASGGMLCLSRNGAARQSAGPVYLVPLSSFENFLAGDAWQIFDYNQ